jgi:hypothetical protein
VRRLTSLPLLFALVSFAHGQDGPRDAATAQDAALALQLYLDAVAQSGGRPDYTKPPAADLFRHVFDLKELTALPPTAASDLNWLLEWGGAVDRSYKQIMLFGLKPDQNLDPAALRRNMAEYEDQYAAAMNFMLRFQARLATTTIRILDELPQEQRTAGRAAGLQQARVGATQTIVGALMAIARGLKPANGRVVSVALRDTRDIWAQYIMPNDRTELIGMLGRIAKTVTDQEVQKNLAGFSAALVAAQQ